MGTNDNLLENLRRESGCDLSQEQIAIRMGLEPDVNGRRSYKVNKFETGITKNWGVMEFFRYCRVTGLDPRLVFATRYPEELYSKMFLNMEQNNYEISGQLMKDYNAITNEIPVIRDIDKNTCIIGKSGTRGNTSLMFLKIMMAMQNGKNIFAIIENNEAVEPIKKKAAETGHKVFVAEYPYNDLNWFASVSEPESISMMVNTLAALSYNEDGPWRDMYIKTFESICKSYLWQDDGCHDEEKELLKTFAEYASNLSQEELSWHTRGTCLTEKDISKVASQVVTTLNTISANEKPQAVKLQEVFSEKHVMLFIGCDMCNDIKPTLALEQYLRMLYNEKGWPIKCRGNREYEVIIENMPNSINCNGEKLIKLLCTAHHRNLTWSYSIVSVEQLIDKYGDNWEAILKSTPSIYLTGYGEGICSDGTVDYISARAGRTTIKPVKRNKRSPVNSALTTEDCERQLFTPDEIMRLNPNGIIHIDGNNVEYFITDPISSSQL